MKQFENVLIITDFDGTFAGRDGRIVVENCDAIKYFTENGGYFTFASGRSPRKMKELFPDFHTLVNAPMIMVNGELLYDASSDEIIEEQPFDADTGIPIAREILTRFPKITLSVTDGEQYTADRMPEAGHNEKWRMMTCVGAPNAIAECYEEFSHRLKETFTVRRPSDSLIDITKKGIHKGAFLPVIRRLLEARGNYGLRIICVGDYENDLDMLEGADLAVCPSNAIDAVKEVCTHVLCDHDDGTIADLINKLKRNEL